MMTGNKIDTKIIFTRVKFVITPLGNFMGYYQIDMYYPEGLFWIQLLNDPKLMASGDSLDSVVDPQFAVNVLVMRLNSV